MLLQSFSTERLVTSAISVKARRFFSTHNREWLKKLRVKLSRRGDRSVVFWLYQARTREAFLHPMEVVAHAQESGG